MPSVRATVAVAAPIDVVYRYLLERYGRSAHCETSLATKGYIPEVLCLDANEPYYLRFHVKGRDPMLRTFIGGWEWEYELRSVAKEGTDVTICYRWSWMMSLFSAGTMRAQASNEMVETAMALDALGWHQAWRQPAERIAQSDDAIRGGDPAIVPNRRLAGTTTRTRACCYLSTPEHVRSFVGTFIYIYTDKGELTLAEDYLRFTGQNQTPIEIALKAITDISIGHYSRIAKLMRLDYLAVSYQKNGTERTLLFTPTRSWLTPVWETNKIVSEWVEALQQARPIYTEQGHSGDGLGN
jgi:hypothetical protein